jgi:hypothetical protein
MRQRERRFCFITSELLRFAGESPSHKGILPGDE